MYVIKFDGKQTHWVSLIIDWNTAVYFDSVGTEYIPQEVFHKIKDKSITHSIFRTQADDSIMCEFLASLSSNIWSMEKLC